MVYAMIMHMPHSPCLLIKQLRLERGLSQNDVALGIGISRPSYVAFEQGKRALMFDEASVLSKMFHISLEDIRAGRVSMPDIFLEKSLKTSAPVSDIATEERISIPEEHIEKFKQILLYLVARIGGKPNIGQTVLYKILYFIDFDYYEKFEEQLIGARYIKNTYGPTPIVFAKIVKELESEGKLETVKSKFYTYEQTKYLVNPQNVKNLSLLSAQELSHIDWEIARLSDLTAVQISGLSHKDTPWLVAKDGAEIDYEYVFYRPEETSVRTYEPL